MSKTTTKKCKSCGEEFEPRNIGSTTIRTNKCLACIGIANLAKIKKDVVAKKKQSLLSLQDHLKLTQGVFNKFIRERDKGNPCISCGKKINGVTHASHYLSSGGHSNVRFDEDNVFNACFSCNVALSGNLLKYRSKLIELLGNERLESLELRGTLTKKWTVKELEELRELYKQKLKELNP
jgi:hypothetical protein